MATPNISRNSRFGSVIDRAALPACIIGAFAPATLTVYAGRGTPSAVLIAIFCVWTVIPSVVVAWGIFAAHSASIRAALNLIAPVVAAGSVAIYSAVAFGLIRAKLG